MRDPLFPPPLLTHCESSSTEEGEGAEAEAWAVAEAVTTAGAWVEVETGAEGDAGTADSQSFCVSTCETNKYVICFATILSSVYIV